MHTDNNAAGSSSAPRGGGRILQFRRRIARFPAADPPIVHPLHRYDEEEDRMRMRENIAAGLVIIVLAISGFWLIDHLRSSARIAVCLEAGHRDCAPLDLQTPAH
jgi:hypothetical protein